MAEAIPIHPVAPRMKESHKHYKKPHVGPHLDAYKAAHAETIGDESDKWWAKVCLHLGEHVSLTLI